MLSYRNYIATCAILLSCAGCAALNRASPYIAVAERAIQLLAAEQRPEAREALQDCRDAEDRLTESDDENAAVLIAELAGAQARLAKALLPK